MSIHVIVLAGPSGSGKSHLAARLGLPVVALDDFYKAASAPDLPQILEGANAGMTDWDHPDSWRLDDAVKAIQELCQVGHTEVPVYSIPQNRPVGSQRLVVASHRYFIAEGIFAPEVVARCTELGVLAGAYCLQQSPFLTFWRRLARDLRERRKPPLVLLRRGLVLMREQRQVVSHAVSLGCRAIHPDEAYSHLSALVRNTPQEPDDSVVDRCSGINAVAPARPVLVRRSGCSGLTRPERGVRRSGAPRPGALVQGTRTGDPSRTDVLPSPPGIAPPRLALAARHSAVEPEAPP